MIKYIFFVGLTSSVKLRLKTGVTACPYVHAGNSGIKAEWCWRQTVRKVGQSDKHVSLSRDPEQHDSPAIRPLSLKYARIETSKRPVPTT